MPQLWPQKKQGASRSTVQPESPRHLRLVVSYDGAAYCGWQVQPNGRAIQAVMAEAIEAVTREKTLPTASGRTDSGVHALGQIVTFRTSSRIPTSTVPKALNANLPDDVVVHSAEEVPADFDPIRHAKWKLYRYVIQDGPQPDVFLRKYCWRIHRRLEVGLMAAAARHLVGRHDFRCFETEWPNRATSVRTVRKCGVARVGDLVSLDVEADGFLYNMVRAIAGTLVEVGRGKFPPDRVQEILASGDRSFAGPTAPANGLFLVRVAYSDGPDGASRDCDRDEGS